jgi:quercetin dioxygenase-like cupin family protein
MVLRCALGIKPLCLDLMRAVEGVELGGVLITRIPPGAECKPHTDPGWHARRYDKYAVQITSAPGQRFHFEGESLETKPGDLFWFDNQFTHWVTNPTAYERVTLIVCIRKEK